MLLNQNKDELVEIARFVASLGINCWQEYRTPYYSPYIDKEFIREMALSREELNIIKARILLFNKNKKFFDVSFNREILLSHIDSQSDYHSSSYVPAWQPKTGAQPPLKVINNAPRINAQGFFTHPSLDYAYNIADFNDTGQLFEFIIKQISIKACLSDKINEKCETR